MLFGKEYWDRVINFKYLSDLGLISGDSLNLFEYADAPLEAWSIIKIEIKNSLIKIIQFL